MVVLSLTLAQFIRSLFYGKARPEVKFVSSFIFKIPSSRRHF